MSHPNSNEARERERMMRLSKLAQEYESKDPESQEREETFNKVHHTECKMFWALVDEYRASARKVALRFRDEIKG